MDNATCLNSSMVTKGLGLMSERANYLFTLSKQAPRIGLLLLYRCEEIGWVTECYIFLVLCLNVLG